ncbi:hypothetical protein KAI30_05125, partial [Candidatus Bathyarchaeota archaeon]|nr:hypothetical protein [Candidatus Bathyarchaeota archaeon]
MQQHTFGFIIHHLNVHALRRWCPELETESSSYRWKILAMSYFCMLAFALVFQSIPPILTLIISELNITHAQAGLIISLFALPG